MNMIEKVARALARADGAKITGPSMHKASDEFKWDAGHRYMSAYVEKHWSEHVTAASIAIDAMREPTEAMLEATDHICERTGDELEIYHAFIDAALK